MMDLLEEDVPKMVTAGVRFSVFMEVVQLRSFPLKIGVGPSWDGKQESMRSALRRLQQDVRSLLACKKEIGTGVRTLCFHTFRDDMYFKDVQVQNDWINSIECGTPYTLTPNQQCALLDELLNNCSFIMESIMRSLGTIMQVMNAFRYLQYCDCFNFCDMGIRKEFLRGVEGSMGGPLAYSNPLLPCEGGGCLNELEVVEAIYAFSGGRAFRNPLNVGFSKEHLLHDLKKRGVLLDILGNPRSTVKTDRAIFSYPDARDTCRRYLGDPLICSD
eukprot:821579-Rhodomonas_salina.1